MSLIARKNLIAGGIDVQPYVDAYVARVLSDGGTVYDQQYVYDAYAFYLSEEVYDAGFIHWSMLAGKKVDANGDLIKLYCLFGNDKDISASPSPINNNRI
jgi:hypothetical protein